MSIYQFNFNNINGEKALIGSTIIALMIAFTHRYLFFESICNHDNCSNQYKTANDFLDHENPIINPP